MIAYKSSNEKSYVTIWKDMKEWIMSTLFVDADKLEAQSENINLCETAIKCKYNASWNHRWDTTGREYGWN